MRTMAVDPSLFDPLEDILVSHFFPQVLGWKPSSLDLRERCGLPTRHGGLGIPIPSRLAAEERAAASKLTGPLTAAILEQDDSYVEDLRGSRARRAQRQRERDKALQTVGDDLATRLSGRAARGFEEARSRGGSAWLSFIPLESLGLDLDAETFRDALALRMGQELPHPLPSTCPSCGEKMSIAHALKCKKGGWVNRRHREVLKAWMRYLEKGGATSVTEEPYLLPVPPGASVRPTTIRETDARADIACRHGGRTTFLDIAVIDTGADSYIGKSTTQILEEKERRKISKYEDRISPHGSFTPLVCSIYGTLGPAASMTAHRVARNVDPDRDERDAVLDLHHVMLQAAILKATSLCLRARAWSALPNTSAVPSLEDHTGWLAEAGARADV